MWSCISLWFCDFNSFSSHDWRCPCFPCVNSHFYIFYNKVFVQILCPFWYCGVFVLIIELLVFFMFSRYYFFVTYIYCEYFTTFGGFHICFLNSILNNNNFLLLWNQFIIFFSFMLRDFCVLRAQNICLFQDCQHIFSCFLLEV